MKKLGFVAALLIAAASCSPKILIQRDTTTLVRTEYVERVKDSLIYIELPKDSVVNATMDTTSHLSIKTASSEASIVNGILVHSLYANADYKPEYRLQIKEVETVRDSIVYVTKEVPVPVEKKMRLRDRLMIYLGYAAIFMLVISGIYLSAFIVTRRSRS